MALGTDANVLLADTYAEGDPDQNGLPLATFRWLREHSPCHRQVIGDPSLLPWAWVVTRHADVHAFARDRRMLSGKGATLRLWEPIVPEHGGVPAMMAMDGQDHVRNRRIVARGFTAAVIRTFEDKFRAMCAELVQGAVAKGTIDFVRDVSGELPLRAFCLLLGVPLEDRADLQKWVDSIAHPIDPEYTASPDEVIECGMKLAAYGVRLAEIRRHDPQEDVMSRVAAAFEMEQLSEPELMGMMTILALGGNETTRGAMSLGLHALITNPDQMALLRSDPDRYMDTAIEEIVRWASPILHVRRTASEKIELHGQTLEAGDPVALMIAAANFDPEAFDEPERFDVTRSPNPHIGFNAGPHTCLGINVARLEIKVMLQQLLEQTSDIQLLGPLDYSRDSFVRGTRTLPVKLIP